MHRRDRVKFADLGDLHFPLCALNVVPCRAVAEGYAAANKADTSIVEKHIARVGFFCPLWVQQQHHRGGNAR